MFKKERWKFFGDTTNQGLTWLLIALAVFLFIIALSDNVYVKSIVAAWVILP
jgi:hypothetical protein